ncbi:MAG: hypothetical protein ACE5F6_17015, partial [Anaerolineae bacterium]
ALPWDSRPHRQLNAAPARPPAPLSFELAQPATGTATTAPTATKTQAPPTNTATRRSTNTPRATQTQNPPLPSPTNTSRPTATRRPTRTPSSTTAPTETVVPTLPATGTPTGTITPTPTSHPGPPTLVAPAEGAVLSQPVSPHEWYFTWDARYGPCYCFISIEGPGGRTIQAGPIYPTPQSPGYEYRYTANEYLPDDALEPWQWSVVVTCPQASNQSEARTFKVERAHWDYLPLLAKTKRP